MPNTDSAIPKPIESRSARAEDQVRRRRGTMRGVVRVLGGLPNVKTNKSNRSMAAKESTVDSTSSSAGSENQTSSTYKRIDRARSEPRQLARSSEAWKQVGWQIVVCIGLIAFFAIAYTAINSGNNSPESEEAGEGIDLQLPAEFDLAPNATTETTLAPTPATQPQSELNNRKSVIQTETPSHTVPNSNEAVFERQSKVVTEAESDEYTMWQHPESKSTSDDVIQESDTTYPTTDSSKYPDASALEAARQTDNRPGMATLRGVIQPPPYQDRSRR